MTVTTFTLGLLSISFLVRACQQYSETKEVPLTSIAISAFLLASACLVNS